MINRVKQKLETNFTILPNEIFDGTLSAKAIGIFAYLCSKDDGWTFYQSEIEKHFKIGQSAVSTGLKELEDNGFLLRYRERSEDGKMGKNIYILYPNKEDYEKSGKAYTGKSHIGKTHIGKSKTNNKDNNNKEGSNKNNTKKINKKKSDNGDDLELSENLNIEAYNAWCEYKGSKYSKRGKNLSANKLSKYSHDKQMEMVENSIIGGYKGLFEPKTTKSNTNTYETDAERRKRVIDEVCGVNISNTNFVDVELLDE